NDMTTRAEGGAGGATAVTPVIAISISGNETKATLGTAADTLKVDGALTASAAHKGSVDTSATGDTKSGDTGVGISIALTVGSDTSSAVLADGSATFDGGSSQSGGVRQAAVTASTPLADVDVTKLLGEQRETTIAVNPTNPQNIIVAPNNTPGIFCTPSRDSL